MLAVVLPESTKKWFEVTDPHSVPVDEHPLRQNIHLRAVLLDLHTAPAEIAEQGVESTECQLADLLWFTEGRPSGFLKYDEVIAFLFEDLQHLGSELGFRHELQIAIG